MRPNANVLIVSTVRETESGVKYWSREEHFFDISKTKEYEDSFNKMKTEKYVLDGSFQDNIWKVSNNREDLKASSLRFPFELNKTLNLALKAFATICIEGKITDAATLINNYRFLNKVLYESNGLANDNLEDLEEYLLSNIYTEEGELKRTWVNSKKMIVRFISFFQPELKDEYISLFERLIKDKRNRKGVSVKSRDIPPFYDLLKFDEIILDFFSLNQSDIGKLQQKYKPIELWWKITTIIPMRIGEFIRLKMNCCYYDNKKQCYYIDIPRIKEKAINDKDIALDEEYEIQTLRIHEAIYNLIEEYKKTIDTTNTFLVNYDFYISNVDNVGSIVYSQSTAQNKESIGTVRFRKLLSYFYKDVVENIYKIDVKNKDNFRLPEDLENELIALQAADTRHIAVSNLVELGINPLSISWFCYHDNIKSQDSYASYIVNEAEVKAKLLGRKLASEYSRAKETINVSSDKLDIIKANEALKNGGFKVDFGVCTAKNGMFDCEDIDCLFCKHFIPIIDSSNKATVKDIANRYKENIIQQLNKTQETITILLEELNKSATKRSDSSFTGAVKDTELLQTAYNQTLSLKNQLAKVESINYLTEEI